MVKWSSIVKNRKEIAYEKDYWGKVLQNLDCCDIYSGSQLSVYTASSPGRDILKCCVWLFFLDIECYCTVYPGADYGLSLSADSHVF